MTNTSDASMPTGHRSLVSYQFVDRAVSLVNRDVEQGRLPGTGVCDSDTAERFATADKRIAFVVVIFVLFVKERMASKLRPLDETESSRLGIELVHQATGK